jgi:hypothetical protein
MGPMTPVKAVVRNGRLVVDEPTELPEGTEIQLVPAEDEAPDSIYEPVSVRDLELEPSGEESELSVSPRAPARSVIARRHLSTIARLLSAHDVHADFGALVGDATARATTHLRRLEDAPEGENYASNAREALANARQALSLLQAEAQSDAELLPAAGEAASAVGMIFSLLE